ncbi:hypothetical protein [Aestuariimicrobium sp. Y1814]|uniref:hypothetical protein n=1 Tax=Aestuariimicrobium sp. Y1814 TaxID=3418742 RepID=UPI003DA6EEAC
MDRKPVIVLVCLAVLVVVLAIIGAVAVARSPTGGVRESWFGSPQGGRLDPADLRVASGACDVSGLVLTFTGACTLAVTPVDGGLPWADAVRRVRLQASTGRVVVAVQVQDRTMRTTLDPGEDIRLVFTRDGGPLSLGCLAVGGCSAALAQDP